MICSGCGTENPDEALYCMSCGKRLDGKKTCPNCGQDSDEKALFCPYCGARFEARPAAPVAAPAAPVAPAPAAPAGMTPVVAAPVAPAAPTPAPDFVAEMPVYGFEEEKEEAPVKRKKGLFDILGICGGAAAMVAVFFSVIFVFCIGLTATAQGMSQSAGNIYDCFGDRYKQISSTLNQFEKDTGPLAASLYIPAIICTLSTIAGLILVPVFSIMAAVKFAKQMKDGKEHGYLKFAVGAFLTFLMTAVIYYAFSTMGLGLSVSGVDIDIVFNGATVAGFALGGVFLGLAVGLKVASRGKELLDVKTIVTCALALVGAIFAIVSISMLKLGQFTMKESSHGQSISFDLSPLGGCIGIGEMYIYDGSLKTPIVELALAILAAMVQVALFIVLAVKILGSAERVTGKKNPGIAVSGAAFGMAVVSLALNIVFTGRFASYMGYEEYVTFSYVAPIVIVVLTALMLAESIVASIFGKKKSA